MQHSGTLLVWCSPGATCVQPSKLLLLQSTALLREIVELPRIPGNTAASKVFEVSSTLDTRNVFYDRFNGCMHSLSIHRVAASPKKAWWARSKVVTHSGGDS